MDKKNMEKIDKLYDLVKERNEQLNERCETIKKNLLTPDMRKIMQTLFEHCVKEIEFDNEGDKVALRFVDTSNYSNPVFDLQYYTRRSSSPMMIHLWSLNTKEYTDDMIRTLERYIKNAKEIDKRLTFIEDHMEEFVRRIGEYYTEFVEKESDKLDELLREMDYEMSPTKHLKVTVEWV